MSTARFRSAGAKSTGGLTILLITSTRVFRVWVWTSINKHRPHSSLVNLIPYEVIRQHQGEQTTKEFFYSG